MNTLLDDLKDSSSKAPNTASEKTVNALSQEMEELKSTVAEVQAVFGQVEDAHFDESMSMFNKWLRLENDLKELQ